MKKILLIVAFACIFIFPSHATEQHDSSALASMFQSESSQSNTEIQSQQQSSQAENEKSSGGSSFIIIVIIVLGVFYFRYRKKRKLITKGFYKQANFYCDKAFINDLLKTAIAVDERGQRLCFYKNNGKYNTAYQVVESMDIISVQLLEDDNVIAETLRTYDNSGPLIGGPLFDDIARSIDKISANSKVQKILLRVLVNSSYNGCCEVLISGKKVHKNSKKYRKIMNDAIDWYNIVAMLMQRFNDSHYYQMPESNINTNKYTNTYTYANRNTNGITSIADELQKLYELKEKGILTEQEFETQKRKILN